MKILAIILIFFAAEIPTPHENGGDNNQMEDSIKKEIIDFENKLFNLPIDSVIDSTGFYVSIYKLKYITTTIHRDKKRRRTIRKKSQSYLRWEADSMLVGNLERKARNWVFADRLILSKDYAFENFKNHDIGDEFYHRYIVGFDKRYLIIRSVSYESNIDSKRTGPSVFTEEYVYYERKN